MAISPYLTFNSQCEAAFKFYEQAFGGKIEMMMRNEQAPPDAGMPVRPERAKYIMHAQMTIDGQVLMGADMLPDSYQKPHGITVAITVADVAEAERRFKAISEGGTIGRRHSASSRPIMAMAAFRCRRRCITVSSWPFAKYGSMRPCRTRAGTFSTPGNWRWKAAPE